ncbi:hypothetical protein XACJK48_9230002 [Xanthomonas citri pv. citri]|nr:hypothetical protein XACS584_1670007 [Xanthomonas citri pv. citri]CEE64130.1 hypothetical protein XAC3608_2110005 [Xanthomonas citri pv. citri]CEH60219.1 hypothetical protein XACJK48_9230002 [Xanthomonas citri pv. citri]
MFRHRHSDEKDAAGGAEMSAC